MLVRAHHPAHVCHAFCATVSCCISQRVECPANSFVLNRRGRTSMYLRKALSKAARLKTDACDLLAHASHLFVPVPSPVQVPRVIIARLDSQTTSQGMPKFSMMCCRMAAAATDLLMPALQQVAMTYARSGVLYDAFSSSKRPLNSASHFSKPL